MMSAAPTLTLLGEASDSYRAAQRDRTQRLEAMLAGVLREQRHAAIMAEQERVLAEQARGRVAFEQALAEHARGVVAFEQALAGRAERISALETALADSGRRVAALEAAEGRGLQAYQIAIGLGAGNIGDELMANAFWRQLPDGVTLEVPLFPMAAQQRAAYPGRHRYTAIDWHGNENAAAEMPGLLVGGTPVTETEGRDWPLGFLAPRLQHFHRRGWVVDALGVGVEALTTPEAKALFAQAFLPIRSWTVRSASCREALLALGVAPHAVKVGADWGWLATPQRDLRDWAEAWLRHHGVDPARPLLLANVVNMFWREPAVRQALAAGLDAAAARHGLQVAFLCNECRDGEFFDAAAARETAGLMQVPAVVLPNCYYAPDEAVALLRHATVTVGQRYHFIVESVLAGTVPIAIPRGPKIRDLATELGIAAVGSVEGIVADDLATAIAQALAERPQRLLVLAARQRELALRAAGNFDLLRTLPPYAPLWRTID
jgi:polysaccharide pyruvyl transferase WcaK-like protein